MMKKGNVVRSLLVATCLLMSGSIAVSAAPPPRETESIAPSKAIQETAKQSFNSLDSWSNIDEECTQEEFSLIPSSSESEIYDPSDELQLKYGETLQGETSVEYMADVQVEVPVGVDKAVQTETEGKTDAGVQSAEMFQGSSRTQNGSVPQSQLPASYGNMEIRDLENKLARIEKRKHYINSSDVAIYWNKYRRLPANYIRKSEINTRTIARDTAVGGDDFKGYRLNLPRETNGTKRDWIEADVDLSTKYNVKDNRETCRLICSDDGVVYYTYDHYKTLNLLIPDRADTSIPKLIQKARSGSNNNSFTTGLQKSLAKPQRHSRHGKSTISTRNARMTPQVPKSGRDNWGN